MSAAEFEVVVGLEVHVQLRTDSKMFCACRARFGEPPNTLVCPVCMGLPGALPVPNRRAIELAIRVGLALGGSIASRTRFDRKQYFYPDLPKGYQISQTDLPVVSNGSLALPGFADRIIRIPRAHLEEDAGKGIHAEGDAFSRIDLNRCGVPLLEIVSAPDIRSADEAYAYLVALKQLLKSIEVSDCDMEKGSLRCDVNVSLRRRGTTSFGTRVELKNLNSFKAVQRAIENEASRQAEILQAGGAVEPETRSWDDDRTRSRSMRKKETAPDYRYFPDPDLPPFTIDDAWIDAVHEAMPELPQARLDRYTTKLGLTPYDAGVLIADPDVCRYFEHTAALTKDAKAAANWVTTELFGLMKGGIAIDELGVRPEALAEIIGLVKDGTLNVRSARDVLVEVNRDPRPARQVVSELGLAQLSDRAGLVAVVRRAIDANPKARADLAAGKAQAAGAIVGFVMRETKGRANPSLVAEILKELLGT